MMLFSCGTCWKEVYNIEKAIACDNRKRWIHLKCKEVKDLDYKYYQKRVIFHFVLFASQKC